MPLKDGSPGNTVGSTINGKSRKAERRKQAFARKAEYDKLSLTEKLKRLPPEGAKRQRARLTAQLAKQKANEKKGDEFTAAAKKLVADGKAVSLSEAKRIITLKNKPQPAAQSR